MGGKFQAMSPNWTLVPLILGSAYGVLADLQAGECGLVNFSICVLLAQCLLMHYMYGDVPRVRAVVFVVPTVISIFIQNAIGIYWVQVTGVLVELLASYAFLRYNPSISNQRDTSKEGWELAIFKSVLSWNDTALVTVGVALILGLPNRILLGNFLVLLLLMAQSLVKEKQELRACTSAMMVVCGIEIASQTFISSTEIGRFLRTSMLIFGVMFELLRTHNEHCRVVELREQKLQQDLQVKCQELHRLEQEVTQQSSILTDVHLSFLANLSHELRTSMNGVSGMIGLLSDSSLSAEAQEYVATLERSVDSLMNLINDSLNYSRMEAQDTLVQEEVSFNLESLLEDAMDLVCSRVGEKDIDVSYNIAESVPLLIGDPTQLRSIICNLLSNAIKFTHEGDVSISANIVGGPTRGEDGTDSVLLEIEVSDTGIGIPVDQLPHIFEPFSKLSAKTITQYGGSGLGLAMCDKLAARVLKGKISVESTEGMGSTFRLVSVQSRNLSRASEGVASVWSFHIHN